MPWCARRTGSQTTWMHAATFEMPSRTLPIPDGIGGVRVDAALTKMLGFSCTFAAEVADAGGVLNPRRIFFRGTLRVRKPVFTRPQAGPPSQTPSSNCRLCEVRYVSERATRFWRCRRLRMPPGMGSGQRYRSRRLRCVATHETRGRTE